MIEFRSQVCLRVFVLCTLYITLQSNALAATTFNGVEFSFGDLSFADEVIRYDPLIGVGPAPIPEFQQPFGSLGVPDSPMDVASSRVSLGNGGLLELGFINNYNSFVQGTPPDMIQ